MPGPEPGAALCLTAAPSTVQDLQLHSSESPSSLEASWGSAPGGQDGYQLVLCHLESQTVVRNVSTSAGTLSYNFSHLLPGSEYVLEITTWAAHLQAKTSTRQWTGTSSSPQEACVSIFASSTQFQIISSVQSLIRVRLFAIP